MSIHIDKKNQAIYFSLLLYKLNCQSKWAIKAQLTCLYRLAMGLV